jgi:imidazolonepropionase-like amidohydrolase
MGSLADAGAPPMEILIGATRHGAEAYGLGRELGTIEDGKIADLLPLEADPLQDIPTSVEFVIQFQQPPPAKRI